ncbi:MAG: hypothetical protein IPG15_05725 [Arcobacter sp.]|nr:hypothetical protein [Arcobacter sp.]
MGNFYLVMIYLYEILQETARTKQIEYEKYWRAMMFEKIRTLEYLVSVDKNIDDSSLAWEFLYLIVYWNGKAELTLVDKQHSIKFTLIYIYTELLKKILTMKYCIH